MSMVQESRGGLQFLYYEVANPLDAVDSASPSDFFLPSYKGKLLEMIGYVISVEGPIVDVLLAKRIARAHGWTRTGPKIRDYIVSLTKNYHSWTKEKTTYFFWPPSVEIGSNSIYYRRCDGLSDARSPDEICMQELIALVRELRGMKFDGDKLVKAMCREVGVQVNSPVSRARFECAISLHESQV